MNTDLLKKAKRLRFTSEDDLLLIRQVRGVNPYFNHERWGDIQESVCEQTGKRFSIRCIKEHVENLINSWIKKERIDKAKSGIEEIQTEMDFLLQEVADLMKEAKLKKETKGKKRSSFQVAKEVRDMWAATSLNTAIELEYPNDQDSHTLPSDHDATEMVLIEIEEGNAAYEQQSLDASSAITDGSLLNQGEENNDHPVRTPQKRKIDGSHKSRTTSTPVHSRVLGKNT
uniref:Uncharacterized protein LOC114339912 n=1 Tax=Diabrotica virgifera virgifera TaxID=50390 RepID=A0A6P7GRH1_DIAVI